jgi:uncharacterized protein YutE (UPF0331/DUF86 family)
VTEVDAALVRRKLARITRNLEDLATVQSLDLAHYIEDRFRHKGTERLLQETVESAVDVNLHLLKAAGLPPSQDYFRSFVEVGRHGVIPLTLAERLAPSTGLRNRLVHEYDTIDDRRVLGAVGDAVRDFGEYVAAVDGWLSERSL